MHVTRHRNAHHRHGGRCSRCAARAQISRRPVTPRHQFAAHRRARSVHTTRPALRLPVLPSHRIASHRIASHRIISPYQRVAAVPARPPAPPRAMTSSSTPSSLSRPPKHPSTSTALRAAKLSSPSPNGAVPSACTYGAVAAAPLRPPKRVPQSRAPPSNCTAPAAALSPPMRTIAASNSFFFPYSLSAANLRPLIGLHAPSPGHVDWISLLVVYWVTLVSEASRGLMLPSTWPFFESLGGTKKMLGVFVASFSMGRMATTMPLGFLSDRYSTATVLCAASLIQVLGHLLYALAPSLRVLFASRVVVGFGSATMSVCRAHITRAIPTEIRTYHFAYLSALQFVGFAVLPGLGGLLATLPEYKPLPWLPFNGFTYPAYLLVLCNMLAVAVVYMFYFDPPRSAAAAAAAAEQAPEAPHASVALAERASLPPDAFALLVCLLVNVVFRGVVAELETVCTPFLMEQYALHYASASYRISAMGFVGLLVYVAFKPIATRFSDRSLLLFGLLLVLLGCAPLAVLPLAARLPLAAYVLCVGVTWSVGYPLGQTAVLALFSKVLGALPAGGLLGLFSATGSVARISFAMLASAVWSSFGRESVFAVIVAYMCMASTLVLITFKRLTPPPST
eukprot:TRINITY_DN232_c2_g1_i1.p1 TRINITY_DN232_c2_g1~~TRINITY_DN232_c2_g1_i1.p1  ORF type:complete len:623 (+),score=145.43 TRINITY_DN232_c2_g1_i1:426-2294(+)